MKPFTNLSNAIEKGAKNVKFQWISSWWKKRWDISGCGWRIFDQRPDLERLLNSTNKLGTVKYSFKTSYLSKMPPKWTEGENFFFCHEKVMKLSEISQISMFLDRKLSLFLIFYKTKKTFPELLKFRWKMPTFLMIRTWISFWVCASSFLKKWFLFSAVLD